MNTHPILIDPSRYTVSVVKQDRTWYVEVTDATCPAWTGAVERLTPVEALVDVRRMETDLEDPTLDGDQRQALKDLRALVVSTTAEAIYLQVKQDGPRVLTALATAAEWTEDTGDNR